MNKKATLSVILCIAIVLLSIMVGSVSVSVHEMIQILKNVLFQIPLTDVSENIKTIFVQIRIPRALMAFLVGGMLSSAGCVLQAILQNPLASGYTLGVSSGASLGACIVIAFSLSSVLLPIAAFLTGLLTVLLIMAMSQRFDRSLSNQTIILVGMVFSLFVNGILTLLTSLHSQQLRQLYTWMMGSFSGQGWNHVRILIPIAILCMAVLLYYSKELDILTFGDLQASSMGVEVKKMKYIGIFVSTLLTAFCVCFTGVIGFVDLVTPHIVRRVFGSKHRITLPMCFLWGGAFLALADMVSRTLLSPIEIPVGAVTALTGAPFFAYIYFHGDKKWKSK